MSAVFDFSASLNDVAPVFPMLFTDEFNENGKELIVEDAICVLFLLSSQPKSNFSSVLFDFNASLIDVAPLPPMVLPVDFYENEKGWIVDGCHLRVVSSVPTTQIELSECCNLVPF